MNIERQHSGLGSVIKRAKGTKNPLGKDRVQMALRPKRAIFIEISSLAREWGVSWNEAALRLIDAGLGR